MALTGLEGTTALVTGGGSGIGAASSRSFATAGATVVVTDLVGSAAEAVAASIVEAGGRAVAYPLDVVDEAQWARVMGEVGTVDVLHSNAGPTSHELMSRDLDVLSVDLDVWRRVVDVALTGSMLACRSVLPGMIERRGGSIVCTSSVKGLTGSSMRAAYNSAKGGLHALVRTVAAGYGHAGIRCNAVAPGIVDTPGLRETVGAQRLDELRAAHLLPRLGEAQEIADAVLYLASPASSFVTGQVLVVDGGMTSHTPALSPPRRR